MRKVPNRSRDWVFGIARIGALIGLGFGAVLGYEVAACKGKGTGEQALLRTLYRHIQPCDIVLAHALHCTGWTIILLSQAGAHIVMSQQGCRETNFGAGTRLGNQVPLVKWPRPQRPKWMDAETYNALPDYLPVREIEVDGRVWVSTLQDAKAVSPQEIDALYAMRWNIEVDFRTLKATMAMDVLSCKSQAMIDKEIAVYLLAYNRVRWAMAKAALLSQILPRALSFIGAKRALGILEEHLRHHGSKRAGRMIAIARAAIATLKLPHRPHPRRASRKEAKT